MERMGLVARIEEELERVISLGKVPKHGFLPSEQSLARSYGVSRVTAREALMRLAARGLVVQHPGRRSRAVPLNEAVTLENLSVALHGEGPAHPERQRLLEGYFALKREVTVELLAACCEHASARDMGQLMDACFALGQSARWEEPSVWAKREFELLRLATLVADRPGHFLLVQSLERSFWAMAPRVLPHLDCEAMSRWAQCAFDSLSDRDAQALRRELPVLLQAGDERLVDGPVLARDVAAPQVALHTRAEPSPEENSESESDRGELPDAGAPHRSACPTGSCEPSPTGALPTASAQRALPDADCLHLSACPTGSCQAQPVGGLWTEPVPIHSGEFSGRTPLGAGGLSGLEAPWRAHTWSPVPWGLRPQTPLLDNPTCAAAGEQQPCPRAWLPLYSEVLSVCLQAAHLRDRVLAACQTPSSQGSPRKC